MGVGAGLYMSDVVVKSSRSLSHLLMSSCTFTTSNMYDLKYDDGHLHVMFLNDMVFHKIRLLHVNQNQTYFHNTCDEIQ